MPNKDWRWRQVARTVVWVAAALALLVAPGRAAGKRLVLIAGRPNHPPGMHEFLAGCLLFQKALSSVAGLTVDVYTNGWPTKMVDGKPVDDNSVFDTADAWRTAAVAKGWRPE